MVSAIILAAGRGSRMQSDKNKVFLFIAGKSVLERTLLTFDSVPEVDEIVVVCREGEEEDASHLTLEVKKPCKVVVGGELRQQSVRNGMDAADSRTDILCVHDAARCFVKPQTISDCIISARKYGSGVAAVMMKDTLKHVENGEIVSTIDRSTMARAQTPQVFSRELLFKAHELAAADGFTGTDESSLIERMGSRVKMVEADSGNIKVTTKEDLTFGEFLLGGGEIVIGHGYDVHRLQEGRKLVLGGVDIPFEKGLLGHSDADVLTHAIMDSLLGACGEKDIGVRFPPSDMQYKDAYSLELLKNIHTKIISSKYDIINIDATVVAERPKLASYIDDMRRRLSGTLDIDFERINVKATTSEGLGFTGNEGIAAYAVACLKKK